MISDRTSQGKQHLVNHHVLLNPFPHNAHKIFNVVVRYRRSPTPTTSLYPFQGGVRDTGASLRPSAVANNGIVARVPVTGVTGEACAAAALSLTRELASSSSLATLASVPRCLRLASTCDSPSLLSW